MLVLTRYAAFGKPASVVEFVLPDGRAARVVVLDNPEPGRVKLGFEFPAGVAIDRAEVAARKRAVLAAAAERDGLSADERAARGVGHLWRGE